MTEVWKLDLPSTQKMVLLALADSANDNGACWPAMHKRQKPSGEWTLGLCDKSGLSERAVQSAIKWLVSEGHLTRTEKPGKGVDYIVHPRTTRTPAADAPPQETRDTPAAGAGKPSGTTISEKDKPSREARARKPVSTFVLPSDIPETEWEAYDEMRRKGRASKSWTDRARQIAVNELRKLAEAGHPPGDVLNQSTLNGWAGVYPLKDWNNAGNWQGGTHRGFQRPALVSDLVAAHRERLAVVG